ncbi:MAG: site-specific integrase [Synergistaceae bacterium]|jgi:integrase|nr:site-specific integrase [Synergistaceae bacterium]
MRIVEPIRSTGKIKSMKRILRGKNPRDLLLFVMGINTALRIGDLLSLTVRDVRNDNGQLRTCLYLQEAKTGKIKRFPLNFSVTRTLKSCLTDEMDDTEFLFASARGARPISRVQAWRILSDVARDVGLDAIGTHTLRKTFGYHVYRRTGDLGLVQKLLNHSMSVDTLRYIGIEQDDIDNAYMRLNL